MKNIIKYFLFISMSIALLSGCSTRSVEENATTVENSPAEETAIQAATTPSATAEIALPEGEVMITSPEGFENAVADTSISVIHINSEMSLPNEITFERNDDLEILVETEGVLSINQYFNPVGCSITNNGTIIVSNVFERGITGLTNNGTVIVQAGGVVSSGMSDTENYGTFKVEVDGELIIDRGSIFNNFSELTNNGLVSVKDGGQLNTETGSITNNGTMEIFSFFNGDIGKITGTGTLNDHRE